MSEMACLRSLWETLVAAASSFGLFLVANWGMAYFSGEGFRLQIFKHTMGAFGAPFLAFIVSVVNAMNVRAVKRAVRRRPLVERMNHDSIAIFTICNIFIRFPAALEEEMNNLVRRGYEQIAPADEAKLLEECPLELRPAANEEAAHGFMCTLKLSIIKETALQEKALLLTLGLAPAYKHLTFLRSRNWLLSAVKALQACGYMLTVIQRAAQHLAISPLEAFVTFLCIITALQLLIELYACGHYKYPLVLRLNRDQVRHLSDAEVLPQHAVGDGLLDICILVAAVILPWLLISGLSMSYFFHYLHAGHFICSLSALLFFFALNATPFLALGVAGDLIFYGLYACSFILAVVSTIVDWKAFQETPCLPLITH